MTPVRFIETRKAAWERLDALVRQAGRRGPAGLSSAELHELMRLYPGVAVDVARARMYKIDRATQARINGLAVAAHGLLYRRPSSRPGRAIWRFLMVEYPALFRRMLPYVGLATALFVVAMLGCYFTVRLKPSLAHRFVPEAVDMVDSNPGLSEDDMIERFRKMPNAPLAAGVIVNNISVAFTAFALGITIGVGTCYVILMNAMMLAGFAAHFVNNDLGFKFYSCITAHGVLEIMAILIAAGAGLRLGMSIAVPGRTSRVASLRAGAKDAVLLVVGTMPMFVVAGIAEGFITPSHLPGEMKIAFGAALGFTAIVYLMLSGRKHRHAPTGTD